jgi:hypothetical protein
MDSRLGLGGIQVKEIVMEEKEYDAELANKQWNDFVDWLYAERRN